MLYASLSHPIIAYGIRPYANPVFCCVIKFKFNGSVRYYIKYAKNFNEFEILGNTNGYETLDRAKTFLVERFKERAGLVGISNSCKENDSV